MEAALSVSASRSRRLPVACALFVPKVRGSEHCGVCHFSLLEHSHDSFLQRPLQMKKPKVGGSVDLKAPKGIRPPIPQFFDARCSGLKTKGQTLTLSERSAFKKYDQGGLKSAPIANSSSANELSTENKMPLPKFGSQSASPAANLLRPKPKNVHQPYLSATSPNSSTRSSPLFRSSRVSSPNTVYLVASDKEVVSRAHNFKQILSRFQNAADGTSPKVAAPRQFLKAPSPPDRRHSHHFASDMATPFEERRGPTPTLRPTPRKSPPSLTITIPTPKNSRRPLSAGTLESASSASSSSASSRHSEASGGVFTPLTSPSYLSHVSVSPPTPSRKSSTALYSPRTAALSTPTYQHEFAPLKRSSTGGCRRILSQTSIGLDRPRRAFLGNRIQNKRSRGDYGRPSSQPNLYEIASDISRRSSANPLYVDDSGNSSSNSVVEKRNSAIVERYNQLTVANAKTLAFVVSNLWEQIHYKEQLANSADFARIRFSDFLLRSEQPFLVKGKVLFFYASLDGFDDGFTLMVAPSCQYGSLMVRSMVSGALFRPPIMAELEDYHGDLRRFLRHSSLERTTSAHRVLVMPYLSILSFHSLAAHHLHKTMDPARLESVVCFTMIQLLAALKALQSDGLESLSINFKEFMLAFRLTNFAEGLHDLKEYPQLIFLQESLDEDFEDPLEVAAEDGVGVCRYALRALCTLLHHKMLATPPEIPDRSEYSSALRLATQHLHSDKSSSLSLAKNVLEFAFWGRDARFDSELEAKLWLDQQRATQIDRLIRLLVEQSTAVCEPRERLYVNFLLMSTPRTLFHSSQSLQDQFL
ncbi:hypothetical protein QR680_005608 [Steinernema hermaphroditum]|uniref:Uncharacterized protein n=1 Tax=Steinernema hermaphroditum TaxID=289476 RepID=A0AA39HSN8_9BILA|nr:hypothetical protein QR680_005608 [Steinernema hermaphroditum]